MNRDDREIVSSQPLRVGILGAGGIAERAMVEPALQVDAADVVAIGARDPGRAQAFAERLDLPSFGSYDDVLSNPDVDLIYLALPPVVHALWGLRALQAGKHILCEKPLSVNGTSAAQIAEAAADTGRRAFVGFHYRLHGFIVRLLAVITSGALGEVKQVTFDYSIPHFVVKPGNIRLDGDLGGGAVMDVGCYAVDLIRAAWGDPTVVSATAVLYDEDPRVDMQTDAELRLPSGTPATVRASFIGDDKGSMALRISGSAANLEATGVIVPQWGATLRVNAGNDVLIDERAVEGENSYFRQLEHIAAVLRDGSPSPLDASNGVGTMRVVDQIYLAAGLQPR